LEHLPILSTFAFIQAPEGNAKTFDAAKAFCERQTFVLEKMDEVRPWLDYFSGLRSGRSPAPDANCASSTVRAILNIVGSENLEAAEASRSGLFRFYVGRTMETELADRRIDMDGSFRYRNDIVLAGFIWLLCPGHGEQRVSCVKRNIAEFPFQFVQTSPIFCDFSTFEESRVEWPPNQAAQPLVCADGGQARSVNSDAWLGQAVTNLGE
jgi:hypothetical protein